MYENLQFLDNVIIIKTKDLLPQASEILADLWPLFFIAPKDFKIVWFSNLSTLSVHFEVDSKKASCAINLISKILLNSLPITIKMF
jgi:hypothetical protein